MRSIRFIITTVCLLAITLPLFGLAYLLLFPPPDPWGVPLASYAQIITQHNIIGLSLNSIALSVAVAMGSTLLGGIFAWVEQQHTYTGSRILNTLCLLPIAVPSYILAATLSRSAQKEDFLLYGWPSTGFFPAFLSLLLVTTPYVQLILSAAIQRISASEYEAARLLSPDFLPRFRAAAWPYLRSSVVFAALISFLYAISDFGAVATLNLPVLTWSLFEGIRASDL